MKRDRKRQWVSVLVLIGAFLAPSLTVCAGDINANEQQIIAYYNSTFTYQGKKYVATEAAKSAAYNKLMQDNVNLTRQEVRSAIAQANARMAEGIEKGYLVEVKEEGSGGQDPVDSGQEQEPTGGQEQEPTGGQEQEPTGGQGQTPGNGGGDTELPPGMGNDLVPDMPEDMEKYSADKQTVDREQLLASLPGNGQSVVLQSPGDGTDTLMVADYQRGQIIAVDGSGTVVYAGGLPMKNTGYHLKASRWLLTIAGIGIAALLAAGLWMAGGRKDGEKEIDGNMEETGGAMR